MTDPRAPCPAPERLRRLLDDAPPDDQAELTRHLDDCPRCREALETLSVGDAGAEQASRMLAAAQDDAAAADEPTLRRVLEGLRTETDVAAAGRPGRRGEWVLSFLGPPAAPGSLGRFGGYDVVAVLGQGGMGVVLKAIDPALGRTVALKVLPPHLAGDEGARRRFAREARAAAAVRHENVVTIHAVDEAEGLPFLVMECVEGGSLQAWLERHGPPDLATVLRIGAQAAAGLAAAHARGLVHRDVKPANLMLQTTENTENTEKRKDGNGELLSSSSVFSVRPVVKIADFGLARAAADAGLTQSGVVAGTPMYMAPEQARGERVDARADLFSLGSVLYRLCTGRPPFRGDGPLAVLRQVCDATPPPVRELNPAVPAWLADVIEALHEKRPERRLASAAELADLLRRHLDHLERPAQAPPPPAPVRRRRPARRWRWWWAAAAAALLAAGGLGLFVTLGRPRGPTPRFTFPHARPVAAVAFAPDGQTLATAGAEARVRFWDPVHGGEKGPPLEHNGPLKALAYDGRGELLATATEGGMLRLWRTDDGALAGAHRRDGRTVQAMAFSPDGQTVAVGGGNNALELVDRNGDPIKNDPPLEEHEHSITALAFSPDGRMLASADRLGGAKVWDLRPGGAHVLHDFRVADDSRVRGLAFTADGAALVSASEDGRIKVWDARSWGGPPRVVMEQGDDVLSAAVRPAGDLVVAGGRHGGLKLWELSSGRLRGEWAAHAGAVNAVAFSPDGATLASAGEDGNVHLWDVGQCAGGGR
jgi:serine/threonine protein kinase